MSLRLLVELTTGGVLYRLSDENIFDLTNKWNGFISSFSGVNWRLTKRYGGFAKYNIGELIINQNFWESSPPPWPPEQLVGLNIYYTLSTEAAKVLIVSGTGYRLSQDNENVAYAVYPTNNNSYILNETWLRANVASLFINDGLDVSPKYRWILSGGGTTEYYLQTATGGNPNISEPDRFNNGGSIYETKGTVGALANSEWGYGDNDTLGYSTVYYRFFGLDPDILGTGTLRVDYGTVQSAVPKAFGEFRNKIPARMPDSGVGGTHYAIYFASYVGGTGAKQITNITNPGGGLTTITATTHGFINGETVSVEIGRGDYYNGEYVISGVAANTFNIPKTYTAPTKTTGHAYKAGYWRFYDGGNPYIGTAILSAANTFSLTPPPIGEVTLSGVGYDDTITTPIVNLNDIATLVGGRLGLSVNTTGSRAISPTVAHWETKQVPLKDWYGEILAFYTHVGWNTPTILYQRELGGGTVTTFTEFDVLESVDYDDENVPLGKLVAVIQNPAWDQGVVSDTLEIPYQETDYYFAENIDIDVFNYKAEAIEAEMILIADALKRRNVTLTVSETFFANLPDPAEKFTLSDNYLPQQLTVNGNTVVIEFDFDRDLITLVLKQATAAL
jgi:hypothetical protein